MNTNKQKNKLFKIKSDAETQFDTAAERMGIDSEHLLEQIIDLYGVSIQQDIATIADYKQE